MYGIKCLNFLDIYHTGVSFWFCQELLKYAEEVHSYFIRILFHFSLNDSIG